DCCLCVNRKRPGCHPTCNHLEKVAPPHCRLRGLRYVMVAISASARKEAPPITKPHVRFGSKADICSATRHVRFTPNSDRKSGLPQTVMSALPPKADMCGATSDVRFGP